MGILPYHSGNYDYNSINDPGYDLKRQLSTRQAQLDRLNSYDSLTEEQAKRKQSLERTVATLSSKLNRSSAPATTPSEEAPSTSIPASYMKKTFAEGTVVKKDDSYLKGFFFDARI